MEGGGWRSTWRTSSEEAAEGEAGDQLPEGGQVEEQLCHFHLLHLCSSEVEHLQQVAPAQGSQPPTRHLKVLVHSPSSSSPSLSSPHLVALCEVQGPQPPPQPRHHPTCH